MKDTLLILKPVNELIGHSFYVPAYQRGYRWTPVQVKELLDDVFEFFKSEKTKEAFYCLQPIVLKQKEETNSGNGILYEVIDGQQRLTTILIILQYFNKRLAEPYRKLLFHLEYETRPDSALYLQQMDAANKDKNIDYHYMYQASETVEEWFRKYPNHVGDFESTLLNATKVIWYEVGESEEQVEIFTRLNIGKIPLTNSELIKALLLKSSNFRQEDKDRVRMKQLQVASEWDRIEYTLRDDAFWYFLYNSTEPAYDNRIEYIFDLISGKTSKSGEKHSFYWFSDRFEELKKELGGAAPALDSIWLTVKKYFLTFEEWYHDRYLYHIIGFLICSETTISQLLKIKETSADKQDFKHQLLVEVKSKVDCNIEELEYGDKKVRTVLLLFNIQTILANEKSNMRFPFDLFKKENWDVEHVRSQTDRQITGGLQQKLWIKDMLEYYTGKTQPEEVEAAIEDINSENREIPEALYELSQADKIEHKQFQEIFARVAREFEEDSELDIASITNLALLDATTNRSYKNAFFPVKRLYILGNDKRGVFVPICTKNVFMKAYSKKVDKMMNWCKSDAEAYLKAIQETLKPYLPIQEEKYGKRPK